jgi:hypothetical protein
MHIHVMLLISAIENKSYLRDNLEFSRPVGPVQVPLIRLEIAVGLENKSHSME